MPFFLAPGPRVIIAFLEGIKIAQGVASPPNSLLVVDGIKAVSASLERARVVATSEGRGDWPASEAQRV